MATIRDVAQLAGVSTATVSNVINGKDFVEERIRQKVEEAIGALNYLPNKAARRLRRRKRQRAIKILGLASLQSYTEAVTVMTAAAREEARARGLEVIECLSDADDAEGQNRQIADLIEREVDAVVCFPVDCEGVTPAVGLCNLRGVPFIALNRPALGGDVAATVKSDDYQAGTMLGLYIALNGRGGGARILELEFSTGDLNRLDRRRGFHDVVQASPGLKIVDDLALPWSAGKNWDESLDALTAKLAGLPEVDTVYCHTDELALLTIKALRGLGRLRRVGERGHVAVLGVDGSGAAIQAIGDGWMDATAEQHLLGQAAKAVQVALAAMNDEPIEPSVTVVPIRLIYQGNVDHVRDYWAFWRPGQSGGEKRLETGAD